MNTLWKKGSPHQPPQSRAAHQPRRNPGQAPLSPVEVLARQPIGRAPPLRVLEVLLRLYNSQHTALQKTVSHKTRHDRAQFLRRFFRNLHEKAGFKTLPDPRNLGQKHIQAMVRVWQAEHLAPATIQTYFSFLRGFSGWIGKPGMVRDPSHYGMQLEEYRRSEAAQRDRSWSAQSVDIDAVIARICDHDRYVGASLRLIRAFGLRRKEAVMLRPHRDVVGFEATGLPLEQREAQLYLRIKAGAKGGRERFIPLDTPERRAALAHAQQIAGDQDAHMGNPARDLKYNLHRFSHVLEQFGITSRALGVTAHGLRHEVLIDHYRQITDQEPPVRSGDTVPGALDRPAREAVVRLADHSRTRVADAYLGRPARPFLSAHDQPQAS
ncbi:integrase [Pseudoxanthomonas broegbernensis]|uniref:Integrase n=1 Tax=Pseudoxanthomonas broegbernensis TaxID=83619 RepID=A0A7V8K6L8_9GAMM|nr:integrase domain-containing protein [Pseudoxanthomonas broegbernensis]KAF1685350.1 integrase [Pseudoxanthomonas broegbernensis]MBB6066221.1 integrase [Pseudoxanthomonas broegbernensis]